MENQVYEKRLDQLKQDLLLHEGLEVTPIQRLQHTLPLITKGIVTLKDQVLKDGFTSVDTEIQFFKHIKPQFYALQLYEVWLHGLNATAPVGTREMLKTYYEEELLFLFRQFRLHAFHYQYFKTGGTCLDTQFFLRYALPQDPPLLTLIEAWPDFSSPMDYAVANFIAWERGQEYLLDVITDLYGEQRRRRDGIKRPQLRWTGETINLVELAYGIWLTGQINSGNATITEIIEAFEINFHVKIGLAYRRWFSISKRKRISQTKFIDQLKVAILKRLDDENSL